VKRADKTGQEDLIPIIKAMAEKFELPEIADGFDILNMV